VAGEDEHPADADADASTDGDGSRTDELAARRARRRAG
jgi:hypothetical protein